MKFASAFVVLVCAFVAHASTVANVLSDIAKINTDVTSLDNQIKAFPNSGGSLSAALAVHTAAGGVVTDVNTGTTDIHNITPLPVAEDDLVTIWCAVHTLMPFIITTLSDIVAKKPGFAALPIGGLPALIKADLQSLNSSNVAFELALIANTVPSSLQDPVSSLTSSLNAAFATAIAAYS